MTDVKIIEITERKDEQKIYAERMAKLTPRVITPAVKSRAQYRYEESDQFPRSYEAYLQRPFPTASAWQAAPHARSTDEMVGLRSFDAKQVSHIQSLRKQSKNTQGDFMSEIKERSTVRKEEAEQAFLVTPGITSTELTEEQRAAVIALSGYESPPPPTDEPKRPLLQRFKDQFKIKPKNEIDKSNMAYALYKYLGGKDEDL